MSAQGPLPKTWEAYARALGLELQQRRIDAGLTQEALAYKAGLTRTHYQQMERGSWSKGSPSNPSLKVLVRVALALDIEPGDLLPTVSALRLPDRDQRE